MKKILVLCTTDSMIWNFLVPHIRKLQEKGFIVECACSRTGDFFSWLQDKCGLVVHLIPFERNPFRKSNLKAYFELKKLIKKQGINIVFCHEPVGGAMGRLAGAKMGCKIVYMAHGFHFYKGCPKSNYLYYYIERFLAKKTDYLITMNQEDYEASLKFKATHKIKTNGIGIDLSKFQPFDNQNYLYDELNIAPDNIIILSVGELITRKNHISMIQAIAQANNKKLHYVIAGEGELWDYLNKTIMELNLSNQIHLLGYRQDILQLCNCCQIFALPSLQEGLSVALMEAMACGKPIIASKIRGNIDLIDGERGGILVDANDIPEYAKAIILLSDNEKLRKEYGEYNKTKIQGFSLEIVENQLLDIFQMIGKEDEK